MKEKVHFEIAVLTNQCNNRCSYCYQTKKEDVHMSNDLAIKRIKELKNLLNNGEISQLNIGLFGGEPMLNWSVFELYIEELKNLKDVNINTITNGTLITDKVVEKLKDVENLRVDISLDGDQVSNLMRVSHDKKQTHKIVEWNIKKLMENGINPEIRMTIGRFNYRTFESSLEYIKKLGIRHVHLQFMSYGGYRLTDEQIENVIKISEAKKTKSFKPAISLLRFSEVKSGELDCNDCVINKEDAVWHTFQPNGYIYTRLSSVSPGVPDNIQFSLDFETELSNSNIIDLINYNNGEKRTIKKAEDIPGR